MFVRIRKIGNVMRKVKVIIRVSTKVSRKGVRISGRRVQAVRSVTAVGCSLGVRE